MSDTQEVNQLTLEVLQQAAGTGAAFRCRRRLQPAGGEGDKVFPPTFAGAVYAVEQRRVPGRSDAVTCVLLDSVQSQANRMELALQDALDARRIKMPIIEVSFLDHRPTGDLQADEKAGRLLDDVGTITSLQVPHRLADAILRDSQVTEKADDGTTRLTDFRKSSVGRQINGISLTNATPLFALCPTALLFGMWDSTGPKGGLGPKFERALVSEVVGVGASVHDSHRARGVRRDPLEIRAAVKVVKKADKSWTVAPGKGAGATEPSKINHSSVPFDSANAGVTVEYAEQVTTLSLICLRRLRFPIDGKLDAAVDVAARTVLAGLGLCSAVLAFESGIGLRSRCLLWPEGAMEWELLARPGEAPRKYSLTGDQAVQLLDRAVAAATDGYGLPWQTEPIRLQPSPELLKLVRLSQLEATKEDADGDK